MKLHRLLALPIAAVALFGAATVAQPAAAAGPCFPHRASSTMSRFLGHPHTFIVVHQGSSWHRTTWHHLLWRQETWHKPAFRPLVNQQVIVKVRGNNNTVNVNVAQSSTITRIAAVKTVSLRKLH